MKNYVGIGMTFGAGVGIVVGAVIRNVAVFIPIGAGMGLVLGVVLNKLKQNSK